MKLIATFSTSNSHGKLDFEVKITEAEGDIVKNLIAKKGLNSLSVWIMNNIPFVEYETLQIETVLVTTLAEEVKEDGKENKQ